MRNRVLNIYLIMIFEVYDDFQTHKYLSKITAVKQSAGQFTKFCFGQCAMRAGSSGRASSKSESYRLLWNDCIVCIWHVLVPSLRIVGIFFLFWSKYLWNCPVVSVFYFVWYGVLAYCRIWGNKLVLKILMVYVESNHFQCT
jgi:hypothetical protein